VQTDGAQRRSRDAAGRSRQQTLTLAVICAGVFMLLLDLTVVYVALPSIRTSLHASLTQMQWVVDVYGLSLATTLLACGALADIVGRRRIFCLGLVLFVLASLGCGLVQSVPQLIAARALQGIGAAMIFATSFAIVAVTFAGDARAWAFGVLGTIAAVAGALGPLAGGLLTETFGWPVIFLVNVPVGVAALVVALRSVAETRRPNPPPVDWVGALLVCAVLGLLASALLRGNELGWGSTPIRLLFGGAAACLIAFVLAERHSRQPLLDLALLRRQAFLGVSLAAFAQAATLFSLLLYIAIYLQQVLGYSPFESGLCMLPVPLAAAPPGLAAAWLAVRVPVGTLLAGGLLAIAAGLALLTQIDASSSWTQTLPAFLLAGTGLGLLNPPLAAAAVDVVPAGRAGLGSGINATFRQAGVVLGIAMYGAIFEHRVVGGIAAGVRGTSLRPYAGRISDAIVAGRQGATLRDATPALRTHIFDVSAHAFIGGLRTIIVVAAVVAALSAAAVVVLVRARGLECESAAAPAGTEPAYPEA
jgi:EmrB/QacA subfamily drug resistance transporter